MGIAVRDTVHAEVSSACKAERASSTPARALQRLSCLDSRCFAVGLSFLALDLPAGFMTDQGISIATTQSRDDLMTQNPGLLIFELQ